MSTLTIIRMISTPRNLKRDPEGCKPLLLTSVSLWFYAYESEDEGSHFEAYTANNAAKSRFWYEQLTIVSDLEPRNQPPSSSTLVTQLYLNKWLETLESRPVELDAASKPVFADRSRNLLKNSECSLRIVELTWNSRVKTVKQTSGFKFRWTKVVGDCSIVALRVENYPTNNLCFKIRSPRKKLFVDFGRDVPV